MHFFSHWFSQKKPLIFYGVSAAALMISLVGSHQTIQAYAPLPSQAKEVSSLEGEVTTPYLETEEAVLTALENSFTVDTQKRAQAEAQAARMERQAARQKAEEAAAHLPEGLPLEGVITSEFGGRSDPATGQDSRHDGVDLGVAEGTAVAATAKGTVVFAGEMGDYGLTIVIDHGNGYETWYAHNSLLAVAEGTIVSRGNIIAYSGNTGYSTGPHLHYEIRQNGVPIDPLSPLPSTDEA